MPSVVLTQYGPVFCALDRTTGGKSRSQSQNIGAAAVEHSEGRASVLLFLHADSVLPTGYGHMIRGALEGM